jgi:galactose mutarotase-like enzyme
MEDVMRYKLDNGVISAEIKSAGAELCSLKRFGDNHEYMWQGDAKYWGRHAPILFPIVGKLNENKYTYDGQEYMMTQHGFARDMDFELVEKRESCVAFSLVYSDETKKKYPFDFRLVLSYELIEDSIEVGYEVTNLNGNVMPFSIGAHPAFNWEGPAHFDLGKEVVETFLIGENGIDPVKIPVILESGRLPISKDLFKNDALILEDTNKVSFVNNKRCVEMNFDGFPFVGLWSKPSGAPFVCIEPWYGIADFEGHNGKITEKKGIQLLKAHHSFRAHYTIKIS